MKTVMIAVKGKCATHYISLGLTGELTRMQRHLEVRDMKRLLLRDDKTMFVILEKMSYTCFLYYVLENDFQELAKKYNLPITDKLKFRILVLQNNFFNFSKVAKMLNISTGVLYKSVRAFTDKLYLKMIIEK
jgi:hypothetical protein